MTGEHVERRLAAVLSADIAGYSRLMGADEEGTLSRLKALRKTFVDPTIAVYRGRIVKTTGDGMLVEFASAVDAVRCAVETQRSMTEQNVSVPTDRRIQFRIGIHVGDIIFDDNDIFGDGVNVAARIENECEPGGVYLSDDAFRQVRGKTSFVFEDIGERVLKNIERPIRIYAARGAPAGIGQPVSGGVSAPPRQAPAEPRVPSLVVLPLQNMSGDAEQEYFADGLAENLTTDLSRFGSFLVIGRNTAFTYKGKAIDLKQVGRELGVQYALEGSVQRGGDRIRVNVQLIDTETGGHLWAARFDHDRNDLFKAQDDISRSVANSINQAVSAAELARANREGAQAPGVRELILRASAPALRLTTGENLATRLKLFEQAAELEPQNGEAWASTASCKATRLFLGWSPDRAEDLRSAIAASERALGLVHGHPHVTFARGHVALAARDYPSALENYQRASELNPSVHLYHQMAGMAKTALGKAEEALELQDEALRLSTRDLHAADIYVCKGWALWELQRYPEALPWLERSRAENVQLTLASAFLASTHLRMGQQQKAEATVRNGLQHQPNWTTRVVAESYPLGPASLAALVEDLRKVGLPGG